MPIEFDAEAGLIIQSGKEIKAELEAEYLAAFGQDLDLSEDSPQGQIIGIESEREARIQEVAMSVYLSPFRQFATGTSLDNALADIGQFRLPEKFTTVTGVVWSEETSLVTIPAFNQVSQSATGVIFETQDDIELSAASGENLPDLVIASQEWVSEYTIRTTFSGTPDISMFAIGDRFDVTNSENSVNDGFFFLSDIDAGAYWVEYPNFSRTDATADETTGGTGELTGASWSEVELKAIEAGPFAVSIKSIDTINTPIAGWAGIRNDEAGDTGNYVEKDSEAKVRAAEELVTAQGGTLAAIINKVKEEVDGVEYDAGTQNRTSVTDVNGLPPHSYAMVFSGGDDEAIAKKILEAGGAGIQTHGTTSVSVTDEFGETEIIKFSRVDEVIPYLIVNFVTTSDFPSTGSDDAKELLYQYGTTIKHGKKLLNFKLVDAVQGIPGLEEIEILQGLSPSPTLSDPLVAAADEVFRIHKDRITVNT